MTSLRKFDTTFDTYRFERDLVIVATYACSLPSCSSRICNAVWRSHGCRASRGVARVVLIVNGVTLWISYVMLGFLPILRGHTELM